MWRARSGLLENSASGDRLKLGTLLLPTYPGQTTARRAGLISDLRVIEEFALADPRSCRR